MIHGEQRIVSRLARHCRVMSNQIASALEDIGPQPYGPVDLEQLFMDLENLRFRLTLALDDLDGFFKEVNDKGVST